MRRTTSSWLSTIAKLGFKRRRVSRSMQRNLGGNRSLRAEGLEERRLLTTYWVANILDAGSGSLRQAIIDANSHSGSDIIRFDSEYFSVPREIQLSALMES